MSPWEGRQHIGYMCLKTTRNLLLQVGTQKKTVELASCLCLFKVRICHDSGQITLTWVSFLFSSPWYAPSRWIFSIAYAAVSIVLTNIISQLVSCYFRNYFPLGTLHSSTIVVRGLTAEQNGWLGKPCDTSLSASCILESRDKGLW